MTKTIMASAFVLALMMLVMPLSSAIGVSLGSEGSIGANLGDSANTKASVKANTNVDAETRAEAKAKANAKAGLTAEEKFEQRGQKAQLKAIAKAEIKERIKLHQQEIAESDLDVAIKELDADTTLKASSFTHVFHGNGWATSNDSGEFARIVWAEKSFVDSNGTESERAKGVIKFSSSNAHKLELKSMTENTLVFNVYAKGQIAGTLTLQKSSTVGNFVVWNGNLVLDSGKSYAITLATLEYGMKGNGSGAVEVDKDLDGSADATIDANAKAKGNKLGFWTRFRGLIGRR